MRKRKWIWVVGAAVVLFVLMVIAIPRRTRDRLTRLKPHIISQRTFYYDPQAPGAAMPSAIPAYSYREVELDPTLDWKTVLLALNEGVDLGEAALRPTRQVLTETGSPPVLEELTRIDPLPAETKDGAAYFWYEHPIDREYNWLSADYRPRMHNHPPKIVITECHKLSRLDILWIKLTQPGVKFNTDY